MTDNAKIITASCAAGAAFAAAPTIYGIIKNAAPKPIGDGDALSVRDGNFVNTHGVILTLKGFNLNDEIFFCKRGDDEIEDGIYGIYEDLKNRFGHYGARKLIGEYENACISPADLKHIRKLGANCVRIPVRYFTVFRKEGFKGNIDFDNLDKTVAACRKNGLYVILDLHSAPGFQNNDPENGKSDSCVLFEKNKDGFEARNATVRLWCELAKHFKNEPAIAAFDLLNRPLNRVADVDGHLDLLHKFYRRLYKAIINIDENRIVIMESAGYPESLPDASEYKNKNVAFGIYSHFHTTFETDSLMKTVSKMKNSGVPFIVCKVRTDENWNYSLGAICDKNISWMMGDFKGNEKRCCLYSGSADSSDISSESYGELTEKWKKAPATANFTENKELAKTLKTFFAYGFSTVEEKEKPQINVKLGMNIIKGIKK